MKKDKTTKYEIVTYHCEAFSISLEVSKAVFEAKLKDAQQQAVLENVTDEPNERGEYIETRFRDGEYFTSSVAVFGCGCSETQFIKRVCKEGYCFK